MKNTKTNVIKLLYAMRVDSYEKAKTSPEKDLQTQYFNLALEYDVIITAIKDNDYFNDLCSLYHVKEDCKA